VFEQVPALAAEKLHWYYQTT